MPNGVWTQNWEGVKNYMLCAFIRDGWSTVRDASDNLMRGCGGLPFQDYVNNNAASANAPILVFGTGTNTPSYSDKALTSKWSNNISRVSIVNGEITYDDAHHVATRTVKATIQNTGSASVTVTEWGISIRGERSGGYSSEILLYHAMLDSPVTLAQYESATLTMTISVTVTNPV